MGGLRRHIALVITAGAVACGAGLVWFLRCGVRARPTAARRAFPPAPKRCPAQRVRLAESQYARCRRTVRNAQYTTHPTAAMVRDPQVLTSLSVSRRLGSVCLRQVPNGSSDAQPAGRFSGPRRSWLIQLFVAVLEPEGARLPGSPSVGCNSPHGDVSLRSRAKLSA